MFSSKLRLFFKNSSFTQQRRFNPIKNKDSVLGADQYSAHSPLYMNKYRTEELRSKIFFEHPPVPNRYAKYFILFSICACFSTGVRDKVVRRYKRYCLLLKLILHLDLQENKRKECLDLSYHSSKLWRMLDLPQ